MVYYTNNYPQNRSERVTVTSSGNTFTVCSWMSLVCFVIVNQNKAIQFQRVFHHYVQAGIICSPLSSNITLKANLIFGKIRDICEGIFIKAGVLSQSWESNQKNELLSRVQSICILPPGWIDREQRWLHHADKFGRKTNCYFFTTCSLTSKKHRSVAHILPPTIFSI